MSFVLRSVFPMIGDDNCLSVKPCIVFHSNLAAYIVCRRYKPCEFPEFVWIDSWGNIKVLLCNHFSGEYLEVNLVSYCGKHNSLNGGKSPVGICRRVEALQFFHVFKTVLIVSHRRDEVLTWLIFHLFGNLSANN